MKKIAFIFLTAALLSAPARSFAWGAKGHQIVAEIAFHFLSDSVKQKVMKYLKGMSIEEAATWMDEMRSNDYYNYMKSWHYINIDSGQTYHPGIEHNIVTVLYSAITELEHRQTLSATAIKNDLLMIFHLIGDLHQPLHVGYGSDRGGNDIAVSFISKNNRTNLHSVWDDGIIDVEKITIDSCLQLYNHYTPEEIARIKKINVVSWLNESRTYLGAVYDFKNGFLDQGYADKNRYVVEEQLLKGGLRLAGILETLFR